MLEFGSLWWVVILAAVVVWIVSAVVWMVLPHHASDFGKLPNEGAAMEGIGGDVPAGQYRMPFCGSMDEMKDESYQAKEAKGPVALLTVFQKGPQNMGKMLGLWFGYCLVATFVIAYLARMVLPAGTMRRQVERDDVRRAGHGRPRREVVGTKVDLVDHTNIDNGSVHDSNVAPHLFRRKGRKVPFPGRARLPPSLITRLTAVR